MVKATKYISLFLVFFPKNSDHSLVYFLSKKVEDSVKIKKVFARFKCINSNFDTVKNYINKLRFSLPITLKRKWKKDDWKQILKLQHF